MRAFARDSHHGDEAAAHAPVARTNGATTQVAKLPYGGINRVRFEGTVSTRGREGRGYPRFMAALDRQTDGGASIRPPYPSE